MATEKIPLVSVIIPMYNSAKFIPQTLESLLYQTMKDFEVVVVDDYSTDNSVEVVEGFKMRFDSLGVKLHVIKLPKNTGKPGLPRNVGIQFARGKYIAFFDSDDLYTKTALEELSTLAEKSQADVVHTDTFFALFDEEPKSDEYYLQFKNFEELLVPENVTVRQRKGLSIVKAPIFETQDWLQRLNNWIKLAYNWESFTMFCKRDFLIANQIKFPNLSNDEDIVFSFSLIFLVKKFLRVPNRVYIYRRRTESACGKPSPNLAQHFHKHFRVLRDGIQALEEIMERIDFFSERPDYRHAVLESFFNIVFPKISSYNLKISSFALNEFVSRELRSDASTFALYLFNTVNIQRFQIMRLQQELAKFQKQ